MVSVSNDKAFIACKPEPSLCGGKNFLQMGVRDQANETQVLIKPIDCCYKFRIGYFLSKYNTQDESFYCDCYNKAL